MPEPRTTRRLDAVALTLTLLAALFVAVVFAGRSITGHEHWAGAVGEWAASAVLAAVGFGAGVFALGWFAWVGLYAAGRTPSRLVVRGAGWLVLTACGCVLVDWLTPQLPVAPVSAFGQGGAVGSWLRFQLTDRLPAPFSAVALGVVAFAGLWLTMDAVSRRLARLSWVGVKRLGHGLKRGNTVVAAGGEKVFAGLGAIGRRMADAASRPKLSADAEPIALAPLPPPSPEVDDIPISRPAERRPVPHEPTPVAPAPPPLRVVYAPEDDDEPAAASHPPRSDLPPGYELPSLSLLADADPFPVRDHEQKLRDRAALLERTFVNFGLNVKVVGIHTGPVITQYEVALETGLRLNKVTNLSDDLALNLGVASVRIVAPLPGRNTVGIEVPNEHRQTVRLKELVLATAQKCAKFKLPVFLGKDVEGRPLVYDMATMPHLLIAGRTGTGKSVCLNAIIHSFLLSRTPEECRLILIDPKKVEFSDYAHIPHLMHPVVTDDKKAEAILAWAVDKMEERYELLRRARVRNIAGYNELTHPDRLVRVAPQSDEERDAVPRTLPYIVLVVDEVGDLLMSMKKEVEGHIIRLAQKSRAAGIHLILATQKPTVDVITGLIKSNLPARVCFQVASRADSAVVLDEKGAEKLLGMGDMLFLQPGTSTIIRGQGAYVDDREIERVTGELAKYEPNYESELLNLKAKDAAGDGEFGDKLRDRDPLYEQAIEIVVREQRGSTSLLQRALGVGYGRASRLIDFMAEDGIVGGFNGSNARDVLLTTDEWAERRRGA